MASRAAALARACSEQVAELVRSGQASGVAQRVIREGTVHCIVIRRGGRPVVALPLAAGLVALLFASMLTAVRVLVALLTDCVIQVEWEESSRRTTRAKPLDSAGNLPRQEQPRWRFRLRVR